MTKFIEAKEKLNVSYTDIANSIGTGYPDAQSICNIFHHKRTISHELLEKIGKFLKLSKSDIQEAYLENRIIFTEIELKKQKAELDKLRHKKQNKA
jgi:cyanate lyase